MCLGGGSGGWLVCFLLTGSWPYDVHESIFMSGDTILCFLPSSHNDWRLKGSRDRGYSRIAASMFCSVYSLCLESKRYSSSSKLPETSQTNDRTVEMAQIRSRSLMDLDHRDLGFKPCDICVQMMCACFQGCVCDVCATDALDLNRDLSDV